MTATASDAAGVAATTQGRATGVTSTTMRRRGASSDGRVHPHERVRREAIAAAGRDGDGDGEHAAQRPGDGSERDPDDDRHLPSLPAGAELVGVGHGGVARQAGDRSAGRDADADLAEGGAQDVRAVAGARHPGGDDRSRARQAP